MKVVISAGHGSKVPGAIGILNEHEEACRVVDALATELRLRGVEVVTFVDTVSTTQDENLNRIVDFHNSQTRDGDFSVHFNAFEQTSSPMGTECWYYSQYELAGRISTAIADVGLINRGPKKSTSLFFLNQTEMPACLLEVCFVDSAADAAIYNNEFDQIITNLANLVEDTTAPLPPRPEFPPWPDLPERPTDEVLFKAIGPCSWFGGPQDTTGVSADEGLAFFVNEEQAPQIFLAAQPAGTTGLARRLNPYTPYVACRWDYSVTPKNMLASSQPAKVTNVRTGKSVLAFPADWGPHEDTGRVADLSPAIMELLELQTDDIVEVIYPVED